METTPKLQTLTVNWARNNATKKDGSPMRDKNGKPMFLVSIKTNETGDKYLGGITYKEIKVGDKLENVEVYTEDYQGKSYDKFRIHSAKKMEEGKVKELESRVARLEEQMKTIIHYATTPGGSVAIGAQAVELDMRTEEDLRDVPEELYDQDIPL